MSYELDPGKEGLLMFFKPWELRIMSYLGGVKSWGANSRAVWIHNHQTMDEPISRASVINFLKLMAEKGVLTVEEKSGKGGYHGIYNKKYTEPEFKQYIAKHFIDKLLKEFPEETRKVLENYI